MGGNRIESTFHVLRHVRLQNVVFAPDKTAFTSPQTNLLSNDFFLVDRRKNRGFRTNLQTPTATMSDVDDDGDLSIVEDNPNPTNNDNNGLTATQEEPEEEPERRYTAEEWYEKHTYNKSVLFAMCIGLKETTGDAALVDLDKQPWSNVPKKDIKPSKATSGWLESSSSICWDVVAMVKVLSGDAVDRNKRSCCTGDRKK